MAAFDCMNCPESNDIKGGGCPLWWEQKWEKRDLQDPEGKVTKTVEKKGCGSYMVQELLVNVVNTVEILLQTMANERNQTSELMQSIGEGLNENNKKMFAGLLSIAKSFDGQQQQLMGTMLAGAQQKITQLQEDNRRLEDGR